MHQTPNPPNGAGQGAIPDHTESAALHIAMLPLLLVGSDAGLLHRKQDAGWHLAGRDADIGLLRVSHHVLGVGGVGRIQDADLQHGATPQVPKRRLLGHRCTASAKFNHNIYKYKEENGPAVPLGQRETFRGARKAWLLLCFGEVEAHGSKIKPHVVARKSDLLGGILAPGTLCALDEALCCLGSCARLLQLQCGRLHRLVHIPRRRCLT